MSEDPAIPGDFAARLAAARAYYGYTRGLGDIGRAEFAEHLNTVGASYKSLQNWERGKLPDDLKVKGLIARLVEITGLPETFFYGRETPVSRRLEQIEQTLEGLGLVAEARDVAVHQRLDEIAAAIAPSQNQARRQP